MNKQEVINKIENISARETFLSEIIWVKRDEVLDIVKQLDELEDQLPSKEEFINKTKRYEVFLKRTGAQLGVCVPHGEDKTQFTKVELQEYGFDNLDVYEVKEALS